MSHTESAVNLPYLVQQTDFTCGPACLMVAMLKLQPNMPLQPEDEYVIWRESNTIYMTDGMAGCGPYGLALAAKNRGFYAEIWEKNLTDAYAHWNKEQPANQLEVLLEMDQLDRSLARAEKIKTFHGNITLESLADVLAKGYVPLVLDSSVEAGHWRVLLDIASDHVLLHDPLPEEGINPVVQMPISKFMQTLTCPHTGAMVALIVGQGD